MAYNVSVQAYGASTTLTVGGDTTPPPEPTIAAPVIVSASVDDSVFDLSISYTPADENDAKAGFLLWLSNTETPDWGSAIDLGDNLSYTAVTALVGTITVVVRAYGAGLTADSDAFVFVYDPSKTEEKVWRGMVNLTGHTLIGRIIPTIGRAAELRVTAAAWGQVLLQWTPVGDAQRYAVYVDAELSVITDESEAVIPGLDEGRHNVAVVALGDSDIPQTLRPEYEEGDQGLIAWTAVDDPDLASYLVGTLVVATVTIDSGELSPTGSGTGRLQVGGRFTGGAVNEDMTLTVADGNVLDYSVQDLTGSVLMLQNAPIKLPFGAEVTPLDTMDTYVVGDTYTLPLMVDTRVLSGELTRGTHTIDVKGVTTMGVEGAAATATVFIPNPDVQCEASLSVDGDGAPVLDWNLTGADGTGIQVFTNIDVDGSLMATVDENHPTVTATGSMGATALPWDGTTAGELRVMLGLVTEWGHVVRVLSLYTIMLPEASAFGVPEITELEQVGTVIRATVAYTYVDNDAGEIIKVSRTGALTYTDSAPLPPGEAGDTVQVIIDVDGTENDGEEVTVTAVAQDAGATISGVESDPMAILMDLHTPVAPASASGVPA